jgi:hypothetical protein
VPELSQLVERIRRNPRDLRAHVDRVMRVVACSDSAAALAALLDLQVALGRGGRELRARLLDKAAPLLGDAPLALLRTCLDTGLDATDPRAAVPGACLALAAAETRQLVLLRNAPLAAASSPLDLAREALAAGDAHTAQWLLETALELDPAQPDISRELLQIYRRGKLHADFRRMRTVLLGCDVAGTRQWRELEQYLASQGGAAQP